MNRYRLIGAGLLATAPAPVVAQEVQPWPTISVSVPIAGSCSATGNVTAGFPAIRGTRPSSWRGSLLGRRLSGSVTLSAGYAHLVTYHCGQPAGIENQAIEQISWAIGWLLGVKISSRTRLEQRFQRGADATNWRLRQQLRLALLVALNGTSLVFWTEPSVALNHTSANRETFDQIRNFAGISVPVAKHVDVDIGYLNQYLHRPTGDVSIDAVPVTVSVRF